MSKIIAYLRASTDKQDLSHQRLEALEFARKKGFQIDDFIEATISSRQTQKQRRIDELMGLLTTADTLVVTELSRLGRSTVEVIGLVNALVESNVRVMVIKQNLDISKHDMNSKIVITLLSLFAELERDIISLRTKEALHGKKLKGQLLGKPKGTLQKTQYDKDVVKIKELLGYGLSIRKIGRFLGYGSHISLYIYVKKRNLRLLASTELATVKGSISAKQLKG